MSYSSDFNHIVLTKKQEESVNYAGSDMLVKGVAGSGKSLVIMKRAIKLSRENRIKKVAVFTFANSLVKYINEVMKEALPKSSNIRVLSFDSHCFHLVKKISGRTMLNMLPPWEQRELVEKAIQRHEAILGIKHRLHDVETEYWAEEFNWIKERNIISEKEYFKAERKGRGGKVRLTKEDRAIVYKMFTIYEKYKAKSEKIDWSDLYTYLLANSNRIPDSAKFDYILIDEAQDFTYAKLKVAKLLTRDTLTIAADQAQKIYKTSFSWSEMGIDIRGRRTKVLDEPFRSTKEIIECAECLQKVNRIQSDNPVEFTDTVIPKREGAKPIITKCRDKREENSIILSIVETCLKNDEVVGILFRTKNEKDYFKNILQANHIEYEEIIKKEEWSLRRSGVKICTLHSAKGLEFDTVIIPYLDKTMFPFQREVDDADSLQIEEILVQERSLLYVGMTRAREYLYMTHSYEASMFLSEIEHEYYTYKDSDGRVIPKPEVIKYVTEDDSSESNVSSSEHDDEVTADNVEVGMAIVHPVYGQGTVVSIKRRLTGGIILEIDFEIGGSKRIKLGAVPLKISR